jgi:spore maturation protein CgeB
VDTEYINKENYILNEDLKKLDLLNQMPIDELKIACIFDSFTMSCYENMCKLIKISFENWKSDLEINKPHMLLVESAWHGNNGQWSSKVQNINKNNTKELQELVSWCKKNKIPTVFWNKEDPVHYEHFVETAKIFDYIFTTDEDSIPRYKNELNHDRVYPLPFAAQPKIHNPIKIYDERIEKACFAGSFYNNKYPNRRKSLENILRLAIQQIGLDIYDRNYNLKNPLYKYPKEFRPYIKGYLDTNELEKCNKGYKIMLNVNSVTNSPTMFSRRVFEGLACGTPVISSYSLGIKNIFKDIIVSSDDIQELKSEFIKLKDKSYYDKKVVKGIRYVLRNHTYKDRILFILDKIAIKINDNKPTLSVISKIETVDELEKIKLMYHKQTYIYKELFILTSNYKLYRNSKEKNEDVKMIFIDNINGKKLINSIVNSNYIGIINVNNFYGEYYFEDLINSALYTDVEFIGKKSFFKVKQKLNKKYEIYTFNQDMEFQYVDKLDLDKCIIKRNVFTSYTLEILLKLIKRNNIDEFKYRYFCIDKYNLIEHENKVSFEWLNNTDCVI